MKQKALADGLIIGFVIGAPLGASAAAGGTYIAVSGSNATPLVGVPEIFSVAAFGAVYGGVICAVLLSLVAVFWPRIAAWRRFRSITAALVIGSVIGCMASFALTTLVAKETWSPFTIFPVTLGALKFYYLGPRLLIVACLALSLASLGISASREDIDPTS